MPKGYRIVRQRFAANAFDGEGSRLFGGRWNKKGIRMVYTSASASLAVLETFMHMGIDAHSISHAIIEIDIPDEIIEEVTAEDLPDEWRDNPAPEACQKFGNDWIGSQRSAVLSVPSIVMPIERNYLINPSHIDYKKITIHEAVKYEYDDRMWKL